ncbi:aminotransferase class I/II-fold pyridoxal phosphate-dependent enzyme [Xenorhabdus bovienii]|uniref:Aminotransferase n=1 Tax=Xenorhabdus bovienii TaxID=40576 RepID=A0AAJ1JBS2_XENBV|nr:aminotransferase class I/II-fold pyridoxal phosphate-dependent enzyme [Xenorhabdus bovienii]MDE1480486.1 aminotransferase class I/II-fold pyridoxal phosphate-dependent enzyme [Xenorhabdus bovienii]MDE1492900.1 aminotransferase class I/II-fold pyridoxal phosphate-dependent enzyme [Xenorhabdus bovienii]MDE9428520.1 aminotransferase class I/II-fold pyridoxal phosphate-dependent enzyme [Xenorhabdus bovienii]MDE9467344.1 aminotransferase class I/II-fold pyridoxal phosphate-dependent enzyme [Xenor
MADITSINYPLPLAPERPSRTREFLEHGTNLRSGELHHTTLTKMIQDIDIPPQRHQFYPYPQIEHNRAAKIMGIDSSCIYFTPGSDIAIGLILRLIARTTGRLIIPIPNYFGWIDHANLNQINILPIYFNDQCTENFCLKTLLDTIQTTPPSIVAISNPNSPTGIEFDDETILAISNSCARQGHLLVIDECFMAFGNIDHLAVLGQPEHIIYVRSFSKGYGLAGARIAAVIASPTIIDILSQERTEAAISGSAWAVLQGILVKEYQIKQICQSIIQAREYVIGTIMKLRPNWQILPSGANFINVKTCGDSPAQLVKTAALGGFYIRDMSSQERMDGYIRIGIGELALMVKFLKQLFPSEYKYSE